MPPSRKPSKQALFEYVGLKSNPEAQKDLLNCMKDLVQQAGSGDNNFRDSGRRAKLKDTIYKALDGDKFHELVTRHYAENPDGREKIFNALYEIALMCHNDCKRNSKKRKRKNKDDSNDSSDNGSNDEDNTGNRSRPVKQSKIKNRANAISFFNCLIQFTTRDISMPGSIYLKEVSNYIGTGRIPAVDIKFKKLKDIVNNHYRKHLGQERDNKLEICWKGPTGEVSSISSNACLVTAIRQSQMQGNEENDMGPPVKFFYAPIGTDFRELSNTTTLEEQPHREPPRTTGPEDDEAA